MKNLTKKIYFTAFLAFFTMIYCVKNQAFSQNHSQNQILNNDIAKEIENLLLFGDDEKEQIEILQNQKTEDEFVINKKNNQEVVNKIDIQVSQKPKSLIDIDVRKKEKIAYSAYLSGQYEVAIEIYKQILEKEPNNNYAKYSLAIIYQKMHQSYEAKSLYLELIKNHSENKEQIIANLLEIIAEESPYDAIYLLSRLSTQNPDSAYLFAQSGLLYEKLNDYENAILNLEKAVKKDKKRLDYRYNLAIIYDKSKNYKKAIENYYEVIKNYNNDKKWQKTIDINQVKSRIEQIR